MCRSSTIAPLRPFPLIAKVCSSVSLKRLLLFEAPRRCPLIKGAPNRQEFGAKCHQGAQQGLGDALRAIEGASGRLGGRWKVEGGRWKVRVPRKQPAANSGKVNSGNR